MMSRNRMKPCEFCGQKPVIDGGGYYDSFASQKLLASGGWTSLYIGANSNGDIVMRACGDDYTDDWLPTFCPCCGRKLKEAKNDG